MSASPASQSSAASTSPASSDPASGGSASHGEANAAGVKPAIFQRLDTTAGFPYSLREYAIRTMWELVERTLIRFSPRRAHGWRRFWLRRFGAQMADTAGTKASTVIKHPWLFSMGEHSMLSERVEIYNLGPVAIGDHTVLSQDVYICAGTHDYSKRNMPLLRPTITIGSGVWICAGAFVGPGVVVGDNAVVGARAVVIKKVPPGSIVAGNPARVLRDRPMDWNS
ncbi:MAG: putative colanic acid biosynthesis acetyltransferase [Planctomycetota bacterium]|nr:putative colanic acid biosynthesis acetyltransferase [Planctomycetota bacterium]